MEATSLERVKAREREEAEKASIKGSKARRKTRLTRARDSTLIYIFIICKALYIRLRGIPLISKLLRALLESLIKSKYVPFPLRAAFATELTVVNYDLKDGIDKKRRAFLLSSLLLSTAMAVKPAWRRFYRDLLGFAILGVPLRRKSRKG